MIGIKVIGIFALAVLTGCSTTAPVYTVSIPNIQKLRDGGSTKIAITKIDLPSVNPEQINSVSLRGSSMVSPYDGSYAKYLREALRAEFHEAGRLAETSKTELSGTLIQNDVNAMGINIGTANIEAQIVVRNNNEIKFDKKITAPHQWESSFAGAIAIPAAINNYQTAMQKLLDALYSDKSFLEALK